MTTVVDVRKGQTNMSHKGEHQRLTKQSMRHQACPYETCRTDISESPMNKYLLRTYTY